MPRLDPRNRVCFWLQRPWRVRLLNVLRHNDGRAQGEFIRTAVIDAIVRAEQAPPVPPKK